jgi:hypothetical protein
MVEADMKQWAFYGRFDRTAFGKHDSNSAESEHAIHKGRKNVLGLVNSQAPLYKLVQQQHKVLHAREQEHLHRVRRGDGIQVPAVLPAQEEGAAKREVGPHFHESTLPHMSTGAEWPRLLACTHIHGHVGVSEVDNRLGI